MKLTKATRIGASQPIPGVGQLLEGTGSGDPTDGGEVPEGSRESQASVRAAIGLKRMPSSREAQRAPCVGEDAVFRSNSDAKQGAELRAWLRAFLEAFRVECSISGRPGAHPRRSRLSLLYLYLAHPLSGGR